jgi:hypothetical protein
MSSTTQTINLKNGKQLILTLREDKLVSKVDVFHDGQLQGTHHKPYGISVEEAIQYYG